MNFGASISHEHQTNHTRTMGSARTSAEGEMMDDKTRELYAAIGRGEAVQFRTNPLPQKWVDWCINSVIPGHRNFDWRIKPRTIRVNGVEVPAPLDVLPVHGCIYAPAPDWNSLYDEAVCDCEYAHAVFERGIAHATKEAAIAHAKAMLIREPA